MIWKSFLSVLAVLAGAIAIGGAEGHEGAYAPVGCEGAPAGAVLQAPEPVGSWVVVFCSSGGHTLAPIPGDVWLLVRDNRAFVLPASEEPRIDGTDPHATYFAEMTTRALAGDELDSAVQMLVQGLDTERELHIDTVELLSLRNNRGDEREVYFYSNKSGPVLALVCFGNCDDSVIFHIDHAIVD